MSDRALTGKVLGYTALMERLVSAEGSPDWSPLSEFVDVEAFARVGTFMEVNDWPAYLDMLTRWASSVDRFETTVHRIKEVDDLVYYEIEERHFRAGAVNTVNSMTVFRFGPDDRIVGLNVYLQAPR